MTPPKSNAEFTWPPPPPPRNPIRKLHAPSPPPFSGPPNTIQTNTPLVLSMYDFVIYTWFVWHIGGCIYVGVSTLYLPCCDSLDSSPLVPNCSPDPTLPEIPSRHFQLSHAYIRYQNILWQMFQHVSLKRQLSVTYTYCQS